MHILIARFNHPWNETELLATATELAPAFSAIPGCLEKTWLTDAAQAAGGIYKFRDEPSLNAYLASDLWRGVAENPHFTNVTTTVYGVLERPSEITGGLQAAAVR